MKEQSPKVKAHRKQTEEDMMEEEFTEEYTPFADTLSLDHADGTWKVVRNLCLVFCFRYLGQLTSVHIMYHPDEYW